MPLGTIGVFTGNEQEAQMACERFPGNIHNLTGYLILTLDALTGAPPLSGKLCADAFTFTSHEEELSRVLNFHKLCNKNYFLLKYVKALLTAYP